MNAVLLGDGPVVIVDDSDSDVLVARRCFRRSRIERELRAFPCGEDFLAFLDAVERGEEPMPSVVLLDINMPGLDGFEVLRRTRERSEFQAVPIFVMLTNSDSPRDVQAANELGANGYQVKPMRVEEYVAFFDSLVE